jgi:hypothetical protein
LGSGGIGSLASHAPDEHPKVQSGNYEERKQWVNEFWILAKAQLKRSAEQISIVDAKLAEAFTLLSAYQAALDRGETPDLAIRKKGRDLLWEIYNMKPSKFR